MANKCLNVPAAVKHVKNHHVLVIYAVNDDVFRGCRLPSPRNTKYRQGRNRRGVRGDEPLARRWLFSVKAGASAPFHVLGKLAHGVFGNDAPFPSGSEAPATSTSRDFYTPALAFFPKGECFLRGFLGPVQTTGSDGLLDERGLVGGRFYFHAPKVRGLLVLCQLASGGENREGSASADARAKVANGLE